MSPTVSPLGFRGFLKGLARPVFWAWDKLDRGYSKITAVIFVAGVLGATGLFTWAEVAAWLRGGWWFAVVAAAGNVVVLAWLGKAAHSLESAQAALAAVDLAQVEPKGAEPNPLTVQVEWGGVGWQRDGQGQPQPFCLKDKTPLMVGHEDMPEFGILAADSPVGEATSREEAGYLSCPRCSTRYSRPGSLSLDNARQRVSAVLIGELRTQKDAYRRKS